MPVNKSMYDAMVKQYGPKRGKEVYFASESAGKPAFKKGLKTAKKEGHTMEHAPKTKKAAPKRKKKAVKK